MKVVPYNFDYYSRSDNVLNLLGLGDIHYGAPDKDEDLLEETIEYIKETDDARWIGMGDYIEAISIKDKRFDLNSIDYQYISPDKQIRKIGEILKPIKDKCIGLLHGNHEYSYWKFNGFNLAEWLSLELDVPYCGRSGYFRIRFRRHTAGVETRPHVNNLNVYAHHGYTNARTDSYKIKSIQDMQGKFPLLPLYMMGHVHKAGEGLPVTKLIVNDALDVKAVTSKFVFTGSYTKAYTDGSIGHYPEEFGMSPNSLGTPVIRCKPNRTDRTIDKTKTQFLINVYDNVRHLY
jgi:hypothetical protein